jgi:hypothetical protein
VNTRVSYLYRDASNFKATESVVLAGELSAEEINLLRGAIALAAVGAGIEPTSFSPVDLGVPPAQEQLWATVERNEDDHIYNELLSIERTMDAVSYHAQSAAGLLATAERVVREGYNVVRAMDVLGIDG